MCSISLWKADLDFHNWWHSVLQGRGSYVSLDADKRGTERLQLKLLCQPVKRAPWGPLEIGLVCIRAPKVTSSLFGSSSFTLKKHYFMTLLRAVNQHCHWSKYPLVHRCYLHPLLLLHGDAQTMWTRCSGYSSGLRKTFSFLFRPSIGTAKHKYVSS